MLAYNPPEGLDGALVTPSAGRSIVTVLVTTMYMIKNYSTSKLFEALYAVTLKHTKKQNKKTKFSSECIYNKMYKHT